jgi:hypothetical protein
MCARASRGHIKLEIEKENLRKSLVSSVFGWIFKTGLHEQHVYSYLGYSNFFAVSLYFECSKDLSCTESKIFRIWQKCFLILVNRMIANNIFFLKKKPITSLFLTGSWVDSIIWVIQILDHIQYFKKNINVVKNSSKLN